MQGENEEGSTSTSLYDDGDELGVDGTEGAVPGDTRDPDVIVALVVLHRLAEDVTELALPHHSPEHVCHQSTGRSGKREEKHKAMRYKTGRRKNKAIY